MGAPEGGISAFVNLDAVIDLSREDDLRTRKRKYLNKVFEELEEVHELMQPKEYDFIESMIKRWEDYDLQMYCSAAQWDWVQRLLLKYCPEFTFP